MGGGLWGAAIRNGRRLLRVYRVVRGCDGTQIGGGVVERIERATDSGAGGRAGEDSAGVARRLQPEVGVAGGGTGAVMEGAAGFGPGGTRQGGSDAEGNQGIIDGHPLAVARTALEPAAACGAGVGAGWVVQRNQQEIQN